MMPTSFSDNAILFTVCRREPYWAEMAPRYVRQTVTLIATLRLSLGPSCPLTRRIANTFAGSPPPARWVHLTTDASLGLRSGSRKLLPGGQKGKTERTTWAASIQGKTLPGSTIVFTQPVRSIAYSEKSPYTKASWEVSICSRPPLAPPPDGGSPWFGWAKAGGSCQFYGWPPREVHPQFLFFPFPHPEGIPPRRTQGGVEGGRCPVAESLCLPNT